MNDQTSFLTLNSSFFIYFLPIRLSHIHSANLFDMDISSKLLIIAMITYATLFCGFIIAGIIFNFFKKRP